MTIHTLGMVSLNIAFILYLFVFIPQIRHNRRLDYLKDLSPMMHWVLYTGVWFDLFYGFANDLQWQYKTVSIVSLLILSIQHVQLSRLFYRSYDWPKLWLNLVLTVSMAASIFYFFVMLQHPLSTEAVLVVGIISRLCYQIYTLPQIIKNARLQNANAVNRHFLFINMTLLFLDTISAWSLDWGWPAKLSPPLSLLMMLILLYQQKRGMASSLEKFRSDLTAC